MKKILMATNGMQIGGAETHILELSIELKRMGHDVTVISRGGVYVQELERNGIVHVSAPLDSKNFLKMIKSYQILKRVIKEGNFDIVHAHARIPAFLCGLLKKKLNFRFITTAHWVFNVTKLLQIMTNWGERTIAVSEDIKAYLIENYGEDPNKITVTINGIDTQKFSPSIDASLLAKELQLDPDKKQIVYVSRMDTDRSVVAFMLLDALEEMNNPDLQAVIVGGGNDFERLKIRVETVNRKLGRKVAVATGARVDINKCVALGDIFIGVSRAALEAMAAKKPVIIAGNEGYIGIFNEATYPVSLATNFCCRGCEQSSSELIKRDLEILLQSDLKELGTYNRQMILDHYSVSRMTFDCVHAYNLLLEQPDKGVIISGYYGYKNIGDDAVLSVIINYLKSICPGVPITILSKTPKETEKLFHVKSIYRFDFIKIYRQMKKSGLLISGGGSLFQDVTSTHSLLYYIMVIKLAFLRGLKVMIYANGIGPIRSPKNKQRTKKVLERVSAISLRDGESLEELKLLGIQQEKIVVTADPAFALEATTQKRVREMFNQEGLDFSSKYVAISVREWQNNCADFEKILAEVCRYLQNEYGITPLFIPMQYHKDVPICKRIIEKAGCGAKMIEGSYKVDELLGVMGRMDMVIGMRLHTIIYALSQKVPVLGLSYDPKVDSMLDYAGIPYKADVASLDVDKLKEEIDAILGNEQELSHQLNATIEQMKDKTKIDAQMAVDILMNRI